MSQEVLGAAHGASTTSALPAGDVCCRKHKQLLFLGGNPSKKNPSQKNSCCWNEQQESPNSRINARLFKHRNFAKIPFSETNKSHSANFLSSLTIHYSHDFYPEPLELSCLQRAPLCWWSRQGVVVAAVRCSGALQQCIAVAGLL